PLLRSFPPRRSSDLVVERIIEIESVLDLSRRARCPLATDGRSCWLSVRVHAPRVSGKPGRSAIKHFDLIAETRLDLGVERELTGQIVLGAQSGMVMSRVIDDRCCPLLVVG